MDATKEYMEERQKYLTRFLIGVVVIFLIVIAVARNPNNPLVPQVVHDTLYLKHDTIYVLPDEFHKR